MVPFLRFWFHYQVFESAYPLALFDLFCPLLPFYSLTIFSYAAAGSPVSWVFGGVHIGKNGVNPNASRWALNSRTTDETNT